MITTVCSWNNNSERMRRGRHTKKVGEGEREGEGEGEREGGRERF